MFDVDKAIDELGKEYGHVIDARITGAEAYCMMVELVCTILKAGKSPDTQMLNKYQDVSKAINNINKRLGELENKIEKVSVNGEIKDYVKSLQKRVYALESGKAMCTCPDHEEPHIHHVLNTNVLKKGDTSGYENDSDESSCDHMLDGKKPCDLCDRNTITIPRDVAEAFTEYWKQEKACDALNKVDVALFDAIEQALKEAGK